MSPLSDDLLDFPLWFTVDECGRWFAEIRSMDRSFMIWGEQRGVKYIVYLPMGWDGQFVYDI